MAAIPRARRLNHSPKTPATPRLNEHAFADRPLSFVPDSTSGETSDRVPDALVEDLIAHNHPAGEGGARRIWLEDLYVGIAQPRICVSQMQTVTHHAPRLRIGGTDRAGSNAVLDMQLSAGARYIGSFFRSACVHIRSIVGCDWRLLLVQPSPRHRPWPSLSLLTADALRQELEDMSPTSTYVRLR